MAQVAKAGVANGASISIDCDRDKALKGLVRTSAGTVVIEGRIAQQWNQIPLKVNSAAPPVDAMSLAAAGSASFEVSGVEEVRARVSAGGPADIELGIGWQ